MANSNRLNLIYLLIYVLEVSMAIHPIEYRYGSEEMRGVFRRDSRLGKMLMVEAVLAKAHAAVGDIPFEAAKLIGERASVKYVKLDRVGEIEREIVHETMAVVKALAEASEPYGGYVHIGATSNDVLDCVQALQLKEALHIIEGDLREISLILVDKAEEYKDLVCLGRTHGMASLPMPFGFKFAVWASEFRRHLERLRGCRGRVCVGKMSGAVGTMAGLGPRAFEIQGFVMRELGIEASEISTQIVPRDGLAEFICLMALISSTLDKVANEIRNLQRSEIGEVEEPFRREGQVGSSTMPHKINPEKCERICGLARVVRSLALASLENVVLEHERDLTNSSCERVVIPEVCLLVDEQLKAMKHVLKGLKVYPENMRRNIEGAKGLIMSEAVMLSLVAKGVDRQLAHELVRRSCMHALEKGQHLGEVLKADEEIRKHLSLREVDEALNPYNYLGTAKEQIDKVVKEVRKYVNTLNQ